MPREAEAAYAFRPVNADDLATIAGWLAEPHVARWWGDDPAEGVAGIAAAMAEPWVEPMIVLIDGLPAGYAQTYDIHAEPGHPYQDQAEGTVGIDITIGEPGLIGCGHGSRIVEALTDRLFARGVPRVVIDPDPANVRAIRAYEKAGFRAFDRRTTIYGPALMMARDAQTRVS